MKLPETYNYAEAYLTFRCNQGCSHCINHIGKFTKRGELMAEGWTKALNKIDFGSVPLTLGGGEPTMHPAFYDIVDGLETKIDLLTNLSFDTEEFIKKVNPDKFTKSETEFYHSIRASYHSEKMDRKELLGKAKRLQNAGFNIGIFGVRHPYNINDNMAMAFMASKSGVPFYEKDFLGVVDGRLYGFYKYPKGINQVTHDESGGEYPLRKTVECKTRELLIDPIGSVYRCHRDLYAGEWSIGNITDDKFRIDDIFRTCHNFGECNPCDVKLKTNKYLKGVECEVEIK